MRSTWEKLGNLDVRVHAYGEKKIFVVPGIADSPDDWQMLAEAAGATVRVPRQPYHAGTREYGQRLSNGREKFAMPLCGVANECNDYRSCVMKAILESDSRILIGHSGGCSDALEFEKTVFPNPGFSLEQLVLLALPVHDHVSLLGSGGSPMVNELIREKGISEEVPKAPPNEAKGSRIRRYSPANLFRTVDILLYPLCKGMPPEMYKEHLLRHWREYGPRIMTIIKHESPEHTHVVKRIAQKLKELTDGNVLEVKRLLAARLGKPLNTPTTVVVGSDDLWYARMYAELVALFSHRADSTTIEEYETAHYPQVHYPKKVANIIQR